MELLGVRFGGGSSVKASALLPYNNNAHPRILLKVFWITVFPRGVRYKLYKISVVQGGSNDKLRSLCVARLIFVIAPIFLLFTLLMNVWHAFGALVGVHEEATMLRARR